MGQVQPFFPALRHPDSHVTGRFGAIVEGIWQGLKVFENADVDHASFSNDTMKDIKRTVRTNGLVRGHRAGIDGKELLPYLEARLKIYLPAYLWVLDNQLQAELEQLRALATKNPVVLLDYETNADLTNLKKPLSHASLVASYLRGEWPE